MSFRLPCAALLSTLGLALTAGACGGIAPSSPGDATPSATGPSADPGPTLGGTDTPAGPPVPKYPIGPYTGMVATTDVSILYPLPLTAHATDLVRASAAGSHGALLPASVVSTVHPGGGLDGNSGTATGYGALGLVSLRLDPCSARGSAGVLGACRSEVRLVFQELYDKLQGQDGDPFAGPAATDGALHVVYDVPEAELVTMLQEILTLKKANGDVGLQLLAPHPILAEQGLGGPFAQGLRDIVLEHVGDDRLVRVTFFDHRNPEIDDWSFGVFDRASASTPFLATTIPTTDSTTQTFAGSGTAGPLAQSYAETARTVPPADSLAPLLGGSRPALGSAEVAALQPAFEAALRLENPTLRNVETTDCVSCHQAEGARRIGDLYSLSTASAFTHARSLARVDERTSVTNVHAFGYLHRQVSIMQRTANESVVVADRMAALLAPPK
jgi:hypothetical protein